MEWQKARQAEYDNFIRSDVIDPLPEDTLPTWDALRRKAWEVVNLVEVCKKKYVDGIFNKFKVRWAFDGRMQKAKNSSAEHPLDTFAPTIRHSSHKCLIAQACMDGAHVMLLQAAKDGAHAGSHKSGARQFPEVPLHTRAQLMSLNN